jgi:putative membrane protein
MKKKELIIQKVWKILCTFVYSHIGPVFLVFVHDLRTICKNLSAGIIIIGLCLLPSLYAWINIYACWDPYSNTGNLPIAIVNKDQGTVFNGKVVNVGNSVIDELKNNKSIGWNFVNDWQGNYGLHNGKYYALIELPSDFSEKLVTLATTNPQKPTIVYCVNEKLNSIATKIADAAKNKLVSSIKTNFVKTVTEEVLNTTELEIESSNLKTSGIKEIKKTLNQANTDVVNLKKYITEANTNSKDFQEYLNKCTTSLPKVNEKISCFQKINNANKSLIQIKKQSIESLASSLNTDVQQLDVLDAQNQKLISQLTQINSNTVNKDVIGVMEQSSNLCSSMQIILRSDAEQIQNLNKTYNLSALSFLADSLNYMSSLIEDEKEALDTQIPLLQSNTSKDSINAALKSLSSLSSEVTKQAQFISKSVMIDGAPLLNNLADDLSIKIDDVNNIAEMGKEMTPQIAALATLGGATSSLTVQQAKQLNDMLTVLQDNLRKFTSKVDEITNQDIDKLIDLVENHPAAISDFISSPIDVKESQVYNTDIFGVGLTPFYTVLAIWVGALLSCALLTVECENTVYGIKLNLKQKHFGKMLLFLFLSFIQSTIITLGDVFLLGVKPANFGLMFGVTMLTSVTFTVIIFTLVSLFGNVGKAIAVVMMVFQIAGAGGIYPIQTNPEIFGILEPLWPFTYAINCFREAIAGPVWSSVNFNVMAMFIFLLVFLALAILKKPFHKLNTFMERKFKEAKI